MINLIKKGYVWLKTNIHYLLISSWEKTKDGFTLLGFLALFISFSDFTRYIFNSDDVYCRIKLGVGAFLCIFIISFITQVLTMVLNKRVKIIKLNGGYSVYVQYGDIFSPNEVLEPGKKRIIVIPVNRCFDTIVDDDLISSRTLHGMAMQRLYDNKIYTQDSLNDIIQKQLQQQSIESINLLKDDKRKGNLKRYPVGTVAEIEDNKNNVIYFFLALSKFNSALKAETSEEEHMLALLKLLKYIDARSQGMPVVLPLIGGFLSRTNISEENILMEIAQLMKMKKEYLHGDIHIVVRNNAKDNVSIYDLAIKED